MNIYLTWTEANTVGAPRIESYAIYRAAGVSDPALIDDLPVIYSATFQDPEIPLNFLDDSVAPEVTYTYYVTALDCYGRELRSNRVVVTTPVAPQVVLPEAPVLDGFNSGFSNKLFWFEPDAGDFPIDGYRLYRLDGTLLTTLDASSTFRTFTDEPLNIGGDYDYYVVAFDTQGNVSAHSNTLTLHVSTWLPTDAASQNDWRGVCWSPSLNLFCAVANNGSGGGRVMTSPDGLTWTTRPFTAQDGWVAVCWSPELSLFVATAIFGTNRAMTSPDGINWTVRTTPNSNPFFGVCWSPALSLFVAVANGGTNRVMTSPNGVNWTARSEGETNSWLSVCWSPALGLFAAVSNGGTHRVMTSPNGTAWTARTAAATLDWRSICWSPELGLFCAVAASGVSNRVMTSTDGINWTAQVSAADSQWDSVCWSPELGRFCAVSVGGESTNKIMISDDGIVWVVSEDGAPVGNLDTNCWSPELGVFCAIGSGSGSEVNKVTISHTG